MAYEICKICGKMFEKDGKEYCESCYDKNKKEYDLVLDYITNHPDHIILDIITETGVSLKSINRFVEEGSISYKDKTGET
jgi:predicted amidophosphoribosyltransferase